MEKYYLNNTHNWEQVIILISLMALFSLPFIFFVRKFSSTAVEFIFSKYIDVDLKVLKEFNVYRFLLHSFLSLYFIFWNNIFNIINLSNPVISNLKDIGIAIYTTISFTMLLLSLINITYTLYKTKAINKRIPISLHAQIVKTIITTCAVAIIISYILNISLQVFFTSLGAAAALLTFIFKDTVTSLLSSLQLTSQDIIRIGERISIPQHNIEGIVEAITITIVTIKNDDNTISTISPNLLLSTNIKNWRRVQETGIRRIQRALYIDMNSINFCSQEFIKALQVMPYLSEKILKNLNEKKIKDEITNIGMFRLYIEEYLKHNNQIHKQDFPIIVRELNPISPASLPIELYIYTKVRDVAGYEKLQAEIFDHLIAVLPNFNLKLARSYSD
ncbi:MAG: mechanosensitive ion channel [Rickettsiaceae bacterium]|nr:mechanosensitive ion channel [Rickettsiaceae bacterium]